MSWLNNISLKAKMGLVIGIAVLGLSVFAWIAYTTVNAVKIGSEEYAKIETFNTATTDILPPPAHLLVVDW
jgi:hypothetical protein